MTRPAKRVLVVDDEPRIVRAIARELDEVAAGILTAASGPEALDLLRAHEGAEVILSDYRMPGMDGLAFLRAAQEIAPRSFRLLLTGQGDVAKALAALEEGAIHRYMTKPWERARLRRTILSLLGLASPGADGAGEET